MSSWDDSFRQLRHDFISRWPDRREALLTAYDLLRLDPASAVHLASLGRAFHNLAGAAGSYGYAGASAIARRAEAVCDDLVRSGAPVSEVDLVGWLAAIDALESALAPDSS